MTLSLGGYQEVEDDKSSEEEDTFSKAWVSPYFSANSSPPMR